MQSPPRRPGLIVRFDESAMEQKEPAAIAAEGRSTVLVNAASSLVEALDADTLAIVTEKVEESLLYGRWERKVEQEQLRSSDQRMEVSDKTVTLWLRADGGALFKESSNWTSYDGKTKKAEEFGSGGSTVHIGYREANSGEGQAQSARKSARRSEAPKVADTFITNPSPEMNGYGRWWLSCEEGDEMVLHIKGDGYMSAGAFEDDDILYHGSGPKNDISFDVPVAKLRENFTHTYLSEAAGSPLEAIQQRRRQRWATSDDVEGNVEKAEEKETESETETKTETEKD